VLIGSTALSVDLGKTGGRAADPSGGRRHDRARRGTTTRRHVRKRTSGTRCATQQFRVPCGTSQHQPIFGESVPRAGDSGSVRPPARPGQCSPRNVLRTVPPTPPTSQPPCRSFPLATSNFSSGPAPPRPAAPRQQRPAAATSPPRLGFTLGSFLASYNANASYSNAVLDALLKTSASGQVLGYRGLAPPT